MSTSDVFQGPAEPGQLSLLVCLRDWRDCIQTRARENNDGTYFIRHSLEKPRSDLAGVPAPIGPVSGT
jgi:hypothetical protein